jgi:hypothetical protein
LANASRKALLLWQAYAFLAPGGGPSPCANVG